MVDIQPMSLGKRLRRERERHHWTQEQLAEKIGGSIPSINRWENDRAVPRPNMVNALTTEFGKQPEHWGMGNHTFWNVPFLRNQYFTGRDQILQRLHQALAGDKTVALSQTRAISGLGGIGKTQTAIEYAYRYAREYEAVLWVQADSHETVVSDFARLTRTLDLQEQEETDQFHMITAVKRWLQEHGPWLLILDNADDLAVVSDFLPRSIGGATLLTTRSHITGTQIKKIEMGRMSQQEGVTFLLRRLTSSGDEDEDLFVHVSAMEQDAALKLWEMMDGLPLALDQAAAYIEARQSSLTEYLDLYRHHRETLLRERGGPISEHPDSVATTWSLSFQRVEQKNPAATELLLLCAFFSPDAIPEELIINGSTHFTTSLQVPTPFISLLNEAISTLSAYSLMQREPKEKTLSIHRLVQAILQDMLTETTKCMWAERALLAVNAAFPEVEHKTWPQCERLLIQALTITQGIERYQITCEEAGHLCFKVASYLRDRGRYAEAEPLYKQALQMREQYAGPEHLDVAIALNNLAILYMYQGKYEQAEPLFKRALQIWEQQSGSEHPDVAIPLHGLATLYVHQGKYEQAEPLYLRVLQIREQQFGPEHPDVATPLNNLAALYIYQGKYEQPEPLFKRAIQIWERQLGPDHPNVAYSLSNLAELYLDQGRYAEANPLFLRALQIWERQEGPDHPDMAYPLNGLAQLSYMQSQYAEAESLFLRTLQIWELQLGPEHPDVATPLHGLANLYRDQARYTQAESLYLRALRIREQTLGPEHPETAKIMDDLAQYQVAQGNCEEARVWYTRALTVYTQAFGLHNSKTEATRKRFITLLHAMGQHEEAIRLEDAP